MNNKRSTNNGVDAIEVDDVGGSIRTNSTEGLGRSVDADDVACACDSDACVNPPWWSSADDLGSIGSESIHLVGRSVGPVVDDDRIARAYRNFPRYDCDGTLGSSCCRTDPRSRWDSDRARRYDTNAKASVGEGDSAVGERCDT